MVGQNLRKLWRDEAPQRLRELAKKPAEKPTAPAGALAHRGDVEPQRTYRRSDSPARRTAVEGRYLPRAGPPEGESPTRP